MKFKILLTILMLCVCLNYVEAAKRRRVNRYQASLLHRIENLTDQMVQCRGMFICEYDLGYGAHCIPSSQVCDGHIHCEGGEDEAFCPLKPPTCQYFEILCPGENRCAVVCNGVAECMSQNDERNCDIKCDKGYVQCSDGKCAVVGDGKKECDDHADENCPIHAVCPTCDVCPLCDTCPICDVCPMCDVCPICDVGELSCITSTSKERQCVSTCDDAIECENEKDKTRLTTCPALCLEGWSRFRKSCYKVFHEEEDRKPWDDARVACHAFGTSNNAHLVIIDDEPENDFVVCKLFEAFDDLEDRSKSAWMDAVSENMDNTFIWEHTEAPLTNDRKFWAGNEPNGKDEHCVGFRAKTNYFWNNTKCRISANYVCEIDDM